MDFLASKFNLYKIETIGDAYVCCSGLPDNDPNHAENVANFAVAVIHCCKQVLSPIDEKPIALRVGINTGPCASGVVGMTNPRYCVFGDTVNTTARHESTGMPGKIHCARSTRVELKQRAHERFVFVERGLVDMKGKGEVLTYWLKSSESNELVNTAALQQLDREVKQLLKKTNFDSTMDKESAQRSFDRIRRIQSNNSKADLSLSPVKRGFLSKKASVQNQQLQDLKWFI
jgi:hypothetical protein